MPFYGITLSMKVVCVSGKTIVNICTGFSVKGPAWDRKGNTIVLSDSKTDWTNVSHCQGIIVQGKSH